MAVMVGCLPQAAVFQRIVDLVVAPECLYNDIGIVRGSETLITPVGLARYGASWTHGKTNDVYSSVVFAGPGSLLLWYVLYMRM